MRTSSIKFSLFASVAVAALIALTAVPASAQQAATPAVAIDNDDIGGVVTGQNGPLISSQPHNASAQAGGSVTFTVSATGQGTVSYQWRFNPIERCCI